MCLFVVGGQRFNNYVIINSRFEQNSEDDVAEVYIAWGLDGISTKGVDRWDINDRGEIKYDNDFDLSDPDAQVHLLNVCEQTRNAECDEKECEGGFLIRQSPEDWSCFITGYKVTRSKCGVLSLSLSLSLSLLKKRTMQFVW